MVDTLQLEVNVQNTQGTPLAGAVIWYIGSPVRPEVGLKLSKDDLTRMALRYASLGDFFDGIDIPATVFQRTNIRGSFFDLGREYTGKKRIPIYLGSHQARLSATGD